MEHTRKGSTRIITPVGLGVIALEYTDQWSAFDRGSSEQLILSIGASRCACAVQSFKLAEGAGWQTHFIKQKSASTILVQEFAVPGHEPLSGLVHGRVLPLEWIWRTHVAGSLLERIRKWTVDPTQKGAIDPTTLGFAPGVVVFENMKLPRMLLECTTKFEKVDRHLTDAEAMELAELTPAQWDEAWQLITKVVEITGRQYDDAGFISPDGKLELGMRRNGTIVLVDVFGTQDENRIIDKNTGHIFSKDLIRNVLKYNFTPWKELLDKAKREHPLDKSKWPPYPKLSDNIVELVAARYAEVALRYAGVRI